MSDEEGPPPDAPPSELVRDRSMEKWLNVLGVVLLVGAAVGAAVGFAYHYLLPDKAVLNVPDKAVLVVSTHREKNYKLPSYGDVIQDVPMVIQFNGKSANHCTGRSAPGLVTLPVIHIMFRPS